MSQTYLVAPGDKLFVVWSGELRVYRNYLQNKSDGQIRPYRDSKLDFSWCNSYRYILRHLKEQFTHKFKFGHYRLSFILMESEVWSCTKHLWSFTAKQHAAFS